MVSDSLITSMTKIFLRLFKRAIVVRDNDLMLENIIAAVIEPDRGP